MTELVDLGGNTLITENIRVGATAPGQAGTDISSAELIFLDGVTAGTATASKAVVLGASKEIATITTGTITNLTTTTLTPTTIAGGTFSTMPLIPTATVAATGTVQGDAAAIATGFTLVTGADDAKGVLLPAAAAGKICIIKVDAGADLKVWPATGDAINAIAANSALTVIDDVCFMLIAYDATTWYTVPLLPS